MEILIVRKVEKSLSQVAEPEGMVGSVLFSSTQAKTQKHSLFFLAEKFLFLFSFFLFFLFKPTLNLKTFTKVRTVSSGHFFLKSSHALPPQQIGSCDK